MRMIRKDQIFSLEENRLSGLNRNKIPKLRREIAYLTERLIYLVDKNAYIEKTLNNIHSKFSILRNYITNMEGMLTNVVENESGEFEELQIQLKSFHKQASMLKGRSPVLPRNSILRDVSRTLLYGAEPIQSKVFDEPIFKQKLKEKTKINSKFLLKNSSFFY